MNIETLLGFVVLTAVITGVVSLLATKIAIYYSRKKRMER